jgi:hypothetical protein
MFRALMAMRPGRRLGQAGHDGVVHRPRNSLMEARSMLGAGDEPAASNSAARSCRRELTPSLVNTLRRCHSTVRALMNSCASMTIPSAARSSAASSPRSASPCLRRLAHAPVSRRHCTTTRRCDLTGNLSCKAKLAVLTAPSSRRSARATGADLWFNAPGGMFPPGPGAAGGAGVDAARAVTEGPVLGTAAGA